MFQPVPPSPTERRVQRLQLFIVLAVCVATVATTLAVTWSSAG